MARPKKMLSAYEIWKKHYRKQNKLDVNVENAMIEFAKQEVARALKAASEVPLTTFQHDYGGMRAGCKYYTRDVDVKRILSSYSTDERRYTEKLVIS